MEVMDKLRWMVRWFVVLTVVGCASQKIAKRHAWEKLLGDEKLAGVVVAQYPEHPGGKREYRGQHPATVFYMHWDGRVRQVQFTPAGEIWDDFWWNLGAEGKGWWHQVDFSWGSDPNFQRHPDPRKQKENKKSD